MRKRIEIYALLALGALCILFGGSKAFGIEVPEKLKGIPLFKGSTIEQSMDMGKGSMLNATVDADGEAVSEFYKKEMSAKGWKTAFSMDQGDSKVINFQKDDMVFQVSVQTEKDKHKTNYQLFMTSNK
jgi:hypothetical protein